MSEVFELGCVLEQKRRFAPSRLHSKTDDASGIKSRKAHCLVTVVSQNLKGLKRLKELAWDESLPIRTEDHRGELVRSS